MLIRQSTYVHLTPLGEDRVLIVHALSHLRLVVDAEVAGGALDLLLVLYRRTPLADAAVSVEGDRSLVDFWIDHSALE